MREAIIQRHNAAVSPDDYVFVLGDVAMTVSNLWPVSLLAGRKILVAGNHDTCWGGKGARQNDGRSRPPGTWTRVSSRS